MRFDQIGFILQASNLVPFLKIKDQLRLVDKVDKKKQRESIDSLLLSLALLISQINILKRFLVDKGSVSLSLELCTMTQLLSLLMNQQRAWILKKQWKLSKY